MFNGCDSLVNLPDISNWNTQSLKKMREMFSGCSALIELPDISQWKLNNVQDNEYVFFGCNENKNPKKIKINANVRFVN